MSVKKTLFREEVKAHRFHRSFGTVRINTPLNYKLSAYGSLCIILVIVLFIHFARFSEQTLIRGYVDAESGIVSIESEDAGMMTRVAVEEGEHVRRGQVLFELSNPNTLVVNARIKHLTEQLVHLKREYQIKKEYYQSLHKLHVKHYISSAAFKESESELLALQRQVQKAEYALTQAQETQNYSIKAPDDGIVTNIMYRCGQRVASGKVVVQLIPHKSRLIARLYIPTRNMGFLKKGQKVYVTYDAYPSQRFGFYEARIEEINQTVLNDDKEDKPLRIGEPYYKIKARLLKPYISVYGNPVRLTHGMTLSAIIRGEKKTIWQRMMDPIYSYYGEQIA